jgi:hypothetical protein
VKISGVKIYFIVLLFIYSTASKSDDKAQLCRDGASCKALPVCREGARLATILKTIVLTYPGGSEITQQ